MTNNRSKILRMTFTRLIVIILATILVSIAMGLFFFFVREDLVGTISAFIACPVVVVYLIYAYRKEKKADKNAILKDKSIKDGNYFDDPKWRADYCTYMNEHPFEKTKYSSMKNDLLARFRRREYVLYMLLMAFLMICACCLMMEEPLMGILGFLISGLIFYWQFSLFIGMPVRKWLKSDIDYNALESSYKHANFLFFKKNGFAFGQTHIHAFTEKEVYAIDYRLVDAISRKIVRLKKYEDSIYSSEEYQHFAVIHVQLPQSGRIYDVEIELNEFQVQMAIDNLGMYKIGEKRMENVAVEQKDDNKVVV